MARLGGGEHYSPPPGGGGGGGGGEIVWLLLRLAWHYPQVGVPVLVVAGVGYWYVNYRMPEGRSQGALRQMDQQLMPAPISQAHLQERLGALKNADPAFDLGHFRERAKSLFLRLQACWSQERLGEAQRFVSGGLFSLMNAAQALHRGEGVRDMVFEPVVDQVTLLGVENLNTHEAVHVQMIGSMVDIDAPRGATPEQIEKLKQQAGRTPFSETWTLLRRRGAVSKNEDDGDRRCPGCGAEAPPGQTVRCEYCGNLFNSGQHDWVLTAITHNDAFFQPDKAPAGFGTLRERDTEISLITLQDRTQAIFYRWMLARRDFSATPLKKVASAEFIQRIAAIFDQEKKAEALDVFEDIVLAGVRLKEMALNEPDGLDHLWMVLQWQAQHRVRRGGRLLPEENKVSHTTVFELVRGAGVRTPATQGLSTETCASCGAPLSASDTPQCDSCGRDFSAADTDWVLHSVTAYLAHKNHPQAAPEEGAEVNWLNEVTLWAGGPGGREAFLKQAVSVAAVNGAVTHREMTLLHRLARRMGVAPNLVQEWVKNNRSLTAESAGETVSSEEAQNLYRVLTALAVADGRLDRFEKKMLSFFAGRMGLAPETAQRLQRSVVESRKKHGLQTVVEKEA